MTQLCRTKSSQGAAMTWTALTGTRCGAGKASGTSRTNPPEQGEEPTMRKGSYSEEFGKACRVKRSTHQTSTIETSAGVSQRRWARIAVLLSTLKHARCR